MDVWLGDDQKKTKTKTKTKKPKPVPFPLINFTLCFMRVKGRGLYSHLLSEKKKQGFRAKIHKMVLVEQTKLFGN